MSLRRLVYLARIELPNRRSNSIQTMRTCHAIAAAGVRVDLCFLGQEPVAREAIFDYYGLEPLDSFALRPLGDGEWRGMAFVCRMREVARRYGRDVAIYTRAFRVARRLIRLRPFLRLPVLIETHMRDGFFDGHHLAQWFADVAAGRTPEPRSTEEFDLLDYCYRRADGVVCLLDGTCETLRRAYPATPVLHAWHGTDPAQEPAYEPGARGGVYYVGNLYEHYQPETLVEAMRLLPGQELFLVGGNDERDVARVRRFAETAGVADRVHFLGHVPPAHLREFYERCRVAVALLAGQKMAEYLSHALPVVAPDLPTVREIFRDGETCLLFKRGSAESLAAALGRVLEDAALARSLARRAHQEALEHTWPKRAARITEFLGEVVARGHRGLLAGRRLGALLRRG